MDSIIYEGKTSCIVTDAKPMAIAKAIGDFISRPLGEMESVSDIRDSVRKFQWSHVADAMIEEYWRVLGDCDFHYSQRISESVAL